MADNAKPDSSGAPVHRTTDFVSRYANNIRVESYATDLKVLFGQSDQASGKEVLEQHTAITLAWSQVKLVIYYLQVQLAIYEAQMGKPVMIHPVSIPPPFPDELPQELKSEPHAKEILKYLRELREQFISKSNG